MTTEQAGRVITAEEAKEIGRGLENCGKGGYFDWPVYMRQLLAKVEADTELKQQLMDQAEDYHKEIAVLKAAVKHAEETADYLRAKGNWTAWAKEQGWLPPEVVKQVDGALNAGCRLLPAFGNTWNLFDAARMAISNAHKPAEDMPTPSTDAPDVSKSGAEIDTLPGVAMYEDVMRKVRPTAANEPDWHAEIAGLNRDVERLTSEVNKLKYKPVTPQQICELGHRGLWDAIEELKERQRNTDGMLVDQHERLNLIAANVVDLQNTIKPGSTWVAVPQPEPAVPVSVLRRCLNGHVAPEEGCSAIRRVQEAIAKAEGGAP